jgi:proline iminopeptidase
MEDGMRILGRIGGWALLALAVLLGGAGAVVAFFAAAFVTSSLAGLCLAALVAGLAISGGLSWLAGKRIMPARRARLALGVGGGTTLLVALAAALTVFWPLARPQAPPPPSGAGYWHLSTGSDIAYRRVPASGAARPTPIIRLHGGPGAYAVANAGFDRFYQRLAADGYTVYVYDQIGGGLSARLADPREYTMRRHIADLESIRQQIGAEQVILLGDSWGGTLAANYMAAHPEHVAKAIFTSPAPIVYAEWDDIGHIDTRLSADQQRQVQEFWSQPRFLAVMALAQINIRAAHAFAPDPEMDDFFSAAVAAMAPGMVCVPAHAPAGAELHGFGFWSSLMTGYDVARRDPNRRELLASNQTPALILTGSCNYIKPEVAEQYQATMPNATIISIPDAGHVIFFDQPEQYIALVRAFLLDQPLPFVPSTASGSAASCPAGEAEPNAVSCAASVAASQATAQQRRAP